MSKPYTPDKQPPPPKHGGGEGKRANWLPDGTGASLSVLEIAGMAFAVLAGLATWGFVMWGS